MRKNLRRSCRRFGRVLRLREGAEAEYDRLHADVWPEIVAAVRDAGIRNYTIFRYRRWLFSYFELPANVSLEEMGERWTRNQDCVRWERLMHDLQEPLPESGDGNWWVSLREVFHWSEGD